MNLSRILRFVWRYTAAAASTAYLFSFGWLWPRNRALIASIAEHFGLAGQREPTGLPRIRPAELLELDGPLTLLEPVAVDGNVSPIELVTLARSVVQIRPRCLFEIGTFDGRTTLNLAANAPEGADVVTLDLPASAATRLEVADGDVRYIEKPASGARFAVHPLGKRIKQVFGDSAQFDFSPWDGRTDWVFIDGAHSYEYVLNDSRVARRLIGEGGGWIFWHDYGVWDGVTRALNELWRQDPYFKGLYHVDGTSLAVLRVPGRPPAA